MVDWLVGWLVLLGVVVLVVVVMVVNSASSFLHTRWPYQISIFVVFFFCFSVLDSYGRGSD